MATEIQSAVVGALENLKFEHVEDDSGVMGGPQKLKPTSSSGDLLKSLIDEGKHAVVDSDGKVTFE